MSNTSRNTVLCRYHYDPLDRQNGCTVLQQPSIQRFNCKERLVTEIQGAARWSILQHDDQLLAQQNHLDSKVNTTLLATDLQRSVLNALDATQPNPLAYTPYGHRPAENGLLSLLCFNGERPDPVTGHYHLGNGYRQFNPVLMRFNSPDSWSPFGKGGLNAYGYCSGDPANQNDPTGHYKVPTLIFDNIFKNAHEFVTNRKTYRFSHFSTARKEAIKSFGGGKKLKLLAESTKTEPDAIIAKVLVEKGKPSRLASFNKGEDANEYLEN
ncbi:RHS repeat-associated core domain-containing protein [Pseudomonas fluorescens]|uniref:RHS repeat-associated core domain-containing protein n=1 Tax=Pseudomonas TaxID=286 RepID=UPI0009BA20C4